MPAALLPPDDCQRPVVVKPRPSLSDRGAGREEDGGPVRRGDWRRTDAPAVAASQFLMDRGCRTSGMKEGSPAPGSDGLHSWAPDQAGLPG